MKKLIIFGFLFCCLLTANAQLSMQKADDGIIIVDGKDKVLKFQVEPKNKDGRFSRCNYIHPLWGLDGQILTEDFPGDHLHHRGVFWTWHQVWIGDERIGDPWEIKDFEQEVLEQVFMKNPGGEVLIKTEVDWKSEKWKKAGKKVPYLKEHTNIVVYPKNANYRKIDFEISLLALEKGLTIGGSEDDKGYSGFSVRMLLPKDIAFEGFAGEIVPQRTAVISEGYVNISGSVGLRGSKGGVVMVDNPENPGYPQPWILRAKDSMQNAAFPGNRRIEISASDPLVLKYSLVVYTGKLTAKKIEKICGL